MVFRLTPALVIHVPSVDPDMASGSPDAKPMPIMTKTRLLRNALRNAPMDPPSPACAKRANFRVDSFVCTSGAEWCRANGLRCDQGDFPGAFTSEQLARPVQMPETRNRNNEKEKPPC